MVHLEQKGDRWDLVGAKCVMPCAALGVTQITPGAYWYRGLAPGGSHIDALPEPLQQSAQLADRLRVGTIVVLCDVCFGNPVTLHPLGVARLVSIEGFQLHGEPVVIQTFQTLNAVSRAA